jgi:hypothetical protein
MNREECFGKRWTALLLCMVVSGMYAQAQTKPEPKPTSKREILLPALPDSVLRPAITPGADTTGVDARVRYPQFDVPEYTITGEDSRRLNQAQRPLFVAEGESADSRSAGIGRRDRTVMAGDPKNPGYDGATAPFSAGLRMGYGTFRMPFFDGWIGQGFLNADVMLSAGFRSGGGHVRNADHQHAYNTLSGGVALGGTRVTGSFGVDGSGYRAYGSKLAEQWRMVTSISADAELRSIRLGNVRIIPGMHVRGTSLEDLVKSQETQLGFDFRVHADMGRITVLGDASFWSSAYTATMPGYSSVSAATMPGSSSVSAATMPGSSSVSAATMPGSSSVSAATMPGSSSASAATMPVYSPYLITVGTKVRAGLTDVIDVEGGVTVGSERGTDRGSEGWIDPHFGVFWRPATGVTTYLRFEPSVQCASLRSILIENPYLVNAPHLRNRRTLTHLVAGADYRPDPGLRSGVFVRYDRIKNMPVFVDKDSAGFWTPFYSDRVTVIGLEGNLAIDISDKDMINVSLVVRRTKDTATDLTVPYQPDLELDVQSVHRFPSGLRLMPNMRLIGSRYTDPENQRALPAYLDIGLRMEYIVTPSFRLSFSLGNIVDADRTLWEGYAGIPRTAELGAEYTW